MSNVPPPPPPPPPPPGGGWGGPPAGGPGSEPPYGGAPPPPSGMPYGQPYGQPTYGQTYGQPYGQYGYGGPGMTVNYASFGARLGALLLDGLLGLLAWAPGIVLLIVSFATGHDALCRSGFDNERITTCRQPNGGLLALAILALIAGVIGWYVFLVLRLGRTGQTPGRKVCGIKVVDKNTGQPLGGGRAFGRYVFAGLISGQICYLGYLWMLWDKEKRTWHDMVLNSIVVKV